MSDKETLAAKLLVKKAIDFNQIFDKSKLDELELERLNDMIEHARSMNCYSGEYVKEDESKAFGE